MLSVFHSRTNLNIAGWSSLVARRAHNPKVVGSNPAPATILEESLRLVYALCTVLDFSLYNILSRN